MAAGSLRSARFVVPLFIVMLFTFDVPIALMLAGSVSGGDSFLKYYLTLLETPVYAKVLGNTFRIATTATMACAIIGYPLAYWMRGLAAGKQLVVLALVVVPFWISILVRTYAWIVILGNAGVVNRALLAIGVVSVPVSFLYNDLGVIIGMVNVLLPFLILPLFASMLRFDDRLLRVAASLGATRWTVFRKVFFPLTRTALAAGAVLVFIQALGFFVTPAILGGGRVVMVSNMLDMLINQMARWELASGISTILLFITITCYAVYRWLDTRMAAS